jgi:hypothetical protein
VFVGGIAILLATNQMADALKSIGPGSMGFLGAMIFQVGPTFLFPVWGVALAVATLGYYFRRRGPCSVCGRGASGKAGKLSSRLGTPVSLTAQE